MRKHIQTAQSSSKREDSAIGSTLSWNVATLGEGDFIGELEFLDLGKEARSATVAAVGPVKLGVLDRDKLRREYDSLSPDFRKIIRTVVQRLRRITVQAASLASS
jgi:CRP-like cAMP-binding protein